MDSDKTFHPSLSAALMKLDPEDGGRMMEYFQTHALLAREKALLQASVREQKKLLVENGKLKKDIEELRHELHDKQRRRVAKAVLSPNKPAGSPTSPAAATASLPTSSAGLKGGRKVAGGQKEDKKAAPEAYPIRAAPTSDISRLDLRVGRIVSVRGHPLAANLTVQDVDVGEKAPRSVVSKRRPDDVQPVSPSLSSQIISVLLCLRHAFSFAQQLTGSLAVLLCNVKACKVKGVALQARLLRCFQSDGAVELLAPPAGSNPGDRVTFLNYPGEPERELKATQRVWDRVQPSLRVDAQGVANYKGCGFQVKGKGVCRAPSLTNCTIGCT
ncbi:aminoacyl tRNA synthase complex-interacting multifunctional protein 1-like isoform X1 [Festucalex cinctus]